MRLDISLEAIQNLTDSELELDELTSNKHLARLDVPNGLFY